MNCRGRLSIVLAFLFLASAAGQEPLTENTLNRGKEGRVGKANIDLLKPIAGHWKGEAMGGLVEEIWSPPQHGEMVGTFRLIIDGKPSFYELMTISEKDGGLLLRIKHFDANFKGWEAQDKFQEFAFLAERDGKFCFEGLTLAPQGKNGLMIYVASESDGKVTELAFEFHRQTPALVPVETGAK